MPPCLRALFRIPAFCWIALLSGAARPAELRSFRTEHYTVHTDLSPALAADMGEELEFAYTEFTRRLSMFEDTYAAQQSRGVRFDVYLFTSRADYLQFTEGAYPNSGGIFMSRKRALAVYLEDQGRQEMRKTLRHEAFHQFAHEKIGPGLPVWVNEGLAQLFEEGIRVDGELRIGQVTPERLRQLQHDLKSGVLVPFETLLKFDDEAWGQTLADHGRAATQYTQAWAMVHFLIYAVDSADRPLYRDRFNAMLREIASGRNGWAAYTGQFGKNFDGFRDKFEVYVAGLLPTSDAQSMERQQVLADLLVILNRRGQKFTRVEDFRSHVIDSRYRLESRRGEVTWSTDPDVSLYFRTLDGRPLEARQLHFLPDPTGEMPSLVRKPGDGLTYRTRFYRLADEIHHETVCEPDR
jgi:hypothetical protein